MQNVILTLRARRERDEAIVYVLKNFGPNRAKQFRVEIKNAIKAIIANPDTFILAEPGQSFRKILIRKELSIIYRADDGVITIVSFWNHRRNPDKLPS
jgi:plasmid stabilization system protein ParE